jgi:hypothetical protein
MVSNEKGNEYRKMMMVVDAVAKTKETARKRMTGTSIEICLLCVAMKLGVPDE